jgi:hypothetical protein
MSSKTGSGVIRHARQQEVGLLEELQLRASSLWPRNREWLAARSDAVELIRLGLVRVAEEESDIVGFTRIRPVLRARGLLRR